MHNGIVENYVALRAELRDAGITPESETDTEIVAQLLGQQVAAGVPLDEAMRTVCRRLQGAFTLVAVDRDSPDVVVAARRNSPLVVGVGRGRELRRLRRGRVHRAHPGGDRARSGPGRADHAGTRSR